MKALRFFCVFVLALVVVMAGTIAIAEDVMPSSASTLAIDLHSDTPLIYADADAMRGIAWNMTKEDVATLEGVKAGKTTVVVTKDVLLHSAEMKKLTYTFDKSGQMISRKFELKAKKDYDTSLYSIFMRYGVPFQMKDKNATWELKDMQIAVKYGSSCSITFTYKVGAGTTDE